jgi:ribosomal protein L36
MQITPTSPDALSSGKGGLPSGRWHRLWLGWFGFLERRSMWGRLLPGFRSIQRIYANSPYLSREAVAPRETSVWSWWPVQQPMRSFKVRAAVKRICEACRLVRRGKRLYVLCEKEPRHKQRQGLGRTMPPQGSVHCRTPPGTAKGTQSTGV